MATNKGAAPKNQDIKVKMMGITSLPSGDAEELQRLVRRLCDFLIEASTLVNVTQAQVAKHIVESMDAPLKDDVRMLVGLTAKELAQIPEGSKFRQDAMALQQELMAGQAMLYNALLSAANGSRPLAEEPTVCGSLLTVMDKAMSLLSINDLHTMALLQKLASDAHSSIDRVSSLLQKKKTSTNNSDGDDESAVVLEVCQMYSIAMVTLIQSFLRRQEALPSASIEKQSLMQVVDSLRSLVPKPIQLLKSSSSDESSCIEALKAAVDEGLRLCGSVPPFNATLTVISEGSGAEMTLVEFRDVVEQHPQPGVVAELARKLATQTSDFVRQYSVLNGAAVSEEMSDRINKCLQRVLMAAKQFMLVVNGENRQAFEQAVAEMQFLLAGLKGTEISIRRTTESHVFLAAARKLINGFSPLKDILTNTN